MDLDNGHSCEPRRTQSKSSGQQSAVFTLKDNTTLNIIEGSSACFTSQKISTPQHSLTTYISSIKKYMTNTWRENINQIAVASKVDSALVITHTWDARITAVAPSFTPNVLQKLCRYILCHIFKSLYEEICRFMHHKHADCWIKLLASGGYSNIHNLGGGG